jgi:hypothetical protein
MQQGVGVGKSKENKVYYTGATRSSVQWVKRCEISKGRGSQSWYRIGSDVRSSSLEITALTRKVRRATEDF